MKKSIAVLSLVAMFFAVSAQTPAPCCSKTEKTCCKGKTAEECKKMTPAEKTKCEKEAAAKTSDKKTVKAAK